MKKSKKSFAKKLAKTLKKQKRDSTSLGGYIGVNIKSRESF